MGGSNIIHIVADSTIQLVTTRVSHSWPWYIVRAAGFAATGLLIALMLSGIGMITGLTYRFLEPLKAWVFHKALAYALCAVIAIHVIFLLFDHYVSFSVPQLLVPFLSQYNNKSRLLGLPLGGLAVAMGIVAMYGVVVIVASSLGWINTKKRAWRWLHYLSYLVMLLVFVHALYVGSDLKYGTFRLGWIMVILVVAMAVVTRLWRAGTLRDKAPKDDK